MPPRGRFIGQNKQDARETERFVRNAELLEEENAHRYRMYYALNPRPCAWVNLQTSTEIQSEFPV